MDASDIAIELVPYTHVLTHLSIVALSRNTSAVLSC